MTTAGPSVKGRATKQRAAVAAALQEEADQVTAEATRVLDRW